MAQYSNTCQSESKVIQVGPQICEIPRLILSRMSSPLMRIWLGVESLCPFKCCSALALHFASQSTYNFPGRNSRASSCSCLQPGKIHIFSFFMRAQFFIGLLDPFWCSKSWQNWSCLVELLPSAELIYLNEEVLLLQDQQFFFFLVCLYGPHFIFKSPFLVSWWATTRLDLTTFRRRLASGFYRATELA